MTISDVNAGYNATMQVLFMRDYPQLSAFSAAASPGSCRDFVNQAEHVLNSVSATAGRIHNALSTLAFLVFLQEMTTSE